MKLEQKLTVKFNHKIEVPVQSYETIQEQGFINLTITGSLSKYSYKWQVNNISEESGIEFGIKFDDPNTIGIFTENEKVTIKFHKYLIFMTQEYNDTHNNSDKKVYLSNLDYHYELHVIIDENDPHISKLNSFAVAVKATLATIMGASIFS